MAMFHPLVGTSLSLISLVLALAGRRGHNRNSYTFAMLVSTFALTMNLTVFVMPLSVGTSIPEPGPAVKLG
ncbi:hypothetical protein [Arthrobacter terricola]|nr:hypothetical protein [Arthrobacter terricola]